MSNANGLSNGAGFYSNYEIVSLERLENSAGNLANFNQQITNNIGSLKYITKAILENWENEDGQDINSILLNLNDAIKTLSEDIQPVIATYVQTLNNIVAETRTNQNRSM